MPRIDLTFSHFEQIVRNGYTLDMIFLLKLVQKEKCNIRLLCEGKPKLAALYQGMIRKHLITEDCKLMVEGKNLLDFIASDDSVDLEKTAVIVKDDEFEKWWAAFPGTDAFTHKGKKFAGSRGLKRSKDDCRLVINKILKEEEYTMDELVEALKLDVYMKMEASLKAETNKLSYMQNSLTYLNQRSFEPFIELVRQGSKPKEETKPIKDIDI